MTLAFERERNLVLDHLIDRQRLLEVAPPEGGEHLCLDRERLRISGRQMGDAMDVA